MKDTSRLVGYDLRKFTKAYLDFRWSAEYREQYLLRPECPYPLSVDGTVWPSRFRIKAAEDVAPLLSPGDIELEPSSGNQNFQLFDLWDDLDEMTSEYTPAEDGGSGIAVGLLEEGKYPHDYVPVEDGWWRAIHGSQINPETPRPAWGVLGYDVANSGFLSALFSFARAPDEREQMRKVWAKHINGSGLFDAVEDAVRFCDDANARLRDDGPFYVFKLFLIWGTPAVQGT